MMPSYNSSLWVDVASAIGFFLVTTTVLYYDVGTQQPTFVPPHVERLLYKEQRRKESVRFLAMKKPMYDNIRMYGPKGNLLCTISQKKARWYLNKGLAQEYSDPETDAIQLLFEPKQTSDNSKSTEGDDMSVYNRTDKQNICVVCAADQHFMRHYVVPYCYRTLLPERYKTHLSHDIVLLCPDCHLHAEQATHRRQEQIEQVIRRQWEKQHQITANTSSPVLYSRPHYQVKSAATALLHHGAKIPDAKRQQLQQVIAQHYQLDFADCSLEEAAQMETHVANPDYQPGPQLVLDCLTTDEERNVFVRDWRRHFVETLQPRYLPQGWSVQAATTSNT